MLTTKEQIGLLDLTKRVEATGNPHVLTLYEVKWLLHSLSTINGECERLTNDLTVILEDLKELRERYEGE